jgi:hypothetical protein
MPDARDAWAAYVTCPVGDSVCDAMPWPRSAPCKHVEEKS